MAHEFKTKRLVEFADTDMAGILHFSNYFRFMEVAEHEFFRSLGLSVHRTTNGTAWGFARGKAECTYRRPLRYEDEVELHLVVRDKSERSLSYEVAFRLPADDGELVEVARGAMTVVCVTTGSGLLRSMPIPAEVAARVEVAPAGVLEA